MSDWLSRNAFPVFAVLLAGGAVVAGFEGLNALIDPAVAADELDAAEREDVPPLAGLIKVSLFLGVGAGIAMPLARRFRASRAQH